MKAKNIKTTKKQLHVKTAVLAAGTTKIDQMLQSLGYKPNP